MTSENKKATFLELVRKCHNYNPKEVPGSLFKVNSDYVGLIPNYVLPELQKFNKRYLTQYTTKTKPFSILDQPPTEDLDLACVVKYKGDLPVVTFNTDHAAIIEHKLDTFEGRCLVIRRMFNLWREEKTFACLAGWRDELYPIFSKDHSVLLTVERAGAGLLGIRSFGVHINGYVKEKDASGKEVIKMWIAKRSKTKQTYPNMYDNIVAGGLPYGQNPMECAIRECMEEASIKPELASTVEARGAVSYTIHSPQGICPETQYIYDLELPKDFEPIINDGEVQGFYLWDFEKITEVLKNNEFKPNCGMVVVEFMVRHGIINPTNEKDYLDIVSGFHNDIGFPGPVYSN